MQHLLFSFVHSFVISASCFLSFCCLIYLDLLLERLAPPASYGLRSVLLPVLPTQHNKHGLVPARSLLSTAGRRPFAPRSPADLAMGDIAKFTKPDGRICRGTVKFVGHLHDKNETYIGLELEYQGVFMFS